MYIRTYTHTLCDDSILSYIYGYVYIYFKQE